MEIKAINRDYQNILKFLYSADRKYCALVDKNQVTLDKLDPDTDKYYRAQARFEEQEARQYDRFHEKLELNPIPKREIAAFTKSYVAFHGYTPYLV